ncbi:hypothetical protein FB451DRAFT_1061675 [Mycena latifolia]|nr:hypothetical protein FB451DRAFT_1061675 [Mycena latifolia]
MHGPAAPNPFSIPATSPPPDTTEAGRPRRNIRLPGRYRDILPEPLLPAQDAPPPEAPAPPALPRVTLIVRDTFETVRNTFGLWRSYLHRPTYDPDSLVSLDDLSNRYAQPRAPPAPSSGATPTTNHSTSLLMNWFNNGTTTKSEGQLNSLVHDVLLDPTFTVKELAGFNAGRANKQADKDAKAAFPLLNDFKEASVEIEVPSGSKDTPSRKFAVPGLYYRSLVSVIKSAFADPLSRHFHFAPFKLFHKMRSSATQIRVFSELYNSDAFIAEHDRIQRHGKLPADDPNCKREKVIAALMFWSDSTHLANFGTAKLWPIYMLFGNLSKYIRVKPNAGAEHHVAYIPSVSQTEH